jgi:hypothetical protein
MVQCRKLWVLLFVLPRTDTTKEFYKMAAPIKIKIVFHNPLCDYTIGFLKKTKKHLKIPISCYCRTVSDNYCHILNRCPYNGFQHILCCVFAWFFFVLCTLCCQFFWIVHIWLPLFYSLTFIQLYGFVFLTTQGHYIFYVNV